MATNISNHKQSKNHNSSVKNCYVGKQVYVGIDVHKRTYSVVTVVEGVVVKKWRTVASPEKLAEQLLRYFSGASIHTAYEAGFSGFVLHRVLEEAGIDNIVVNPDSIEVAIHNRVKWSVSYSVSYQAKIDQVICVGGAASSRTNKKRVARLRR